tara:strand:- start:10568 stop:10819 length:252 start_codon:yes stop_codon:yes gene_type:complete
MKDNILGQIKNIRILSGVIIIYYICYNAYYGWNKTPLNSTEEIFDDITKILCLLVFGMILNVVLHFIQFITKCVELNVVEDED